MLSSNEAPFSEVKELLGIRGELSNLLPKLILVKDVVKPDSRMILVKWEQEMQIGKLDGLVGELKTIDGRVITCNFYDNITGYMYDDLKEIYDDEEIPKLCNWNRICVTGGKEDIIIAERYNIILIVEKTAVLRYYIRNLN